MMPSVFISALWLVAAGNVSDKTKPNLAAQGPLDFRCDNMQVLSKPNRTICTGNVVLKRADMLVCCKELVATANEKWEWQHMVCTTDVRGQRNDETMWADRAEFMPSSSDVVLTGRPLLHRGDSVLAGEIITVNLNDDHARVTRPTGHVADAELNPKKATALPPAATAAPTPLPATCPIDSIKGR